MGDSVMIPTRLRVKLPRHLAHPVGAQQISDALAGLPHADELTLCFWDAAAWPASKWSDVLARQLPYSILTMSYRPAMRLGYGASRSSAEAGNYDEKWEIRVSPVLRQHRHAAQRLLSDEGLPALARWLAESSRPGWTDQSRGIELVFDPTAGELTVRARAELD